MGRKVAGGLLCHFLWGLGSHLTLWPGPTPAFIPSGILIHAAVWPQYKYGHCCAPSRGAGTPSNTMLPGWTNQYANSKWKLPRLRCSLLPKFFEHLLLLPHAVNCWRFCFWRPQSVGFCLCIKYLWNRWTDFLQIHTEDVFGPSLRHVLRSWSKVKVTVAKKWHFSALSAACVCFMFSKTFLASGCCYD